jgi:hypothetical protein
MPNVPVYESPRPESSPWWQQFLAQRQQNYAQQIQRLAQAQPWSGAFNPQPNPLLSPGAPLLRQAAAGHPYEIFGSTLGEAEPMDQMGLLQAMVGRG